MSIYIQLFLSFAKIGFTSFGGMSMVPLILEEMQAHQWMTMEDMSNIIAIAEMTPGPLGLNCATFAGEQTAGILGGIVAVAGALMPAYTLTLFVAVFFTKFRKSIFLERILSVIKPIVIAVIIATILTLAKENYIADDSVDLLACLIAVIDLYLLVKQKWTIPKVILLSAALGIIFHFGAMLL